MDLVQVKRENDLRRIEKTRLNVENVRKQNKNKRGVTL